MTDVFDWSDVNGIGKVKMQHIVQYVIKKEREAAVKEEVFYFSSAAPLQFYMIYTDKRRIIFFPYWCFRKDLFQLLKLKSLIFDAFKF